MYKIPNKITSILDAIENCRVELITWGQPLEKVKVQKGIFQEDCHSLFLSHSLSLPLSLSLSLCHRYYSSLQWFNKMHRSQYIFQITGKDYVYVWHKAICKIWKRIGKPWLKNANIYSQGIRMEFGIVKCAILMMKNG